MARAGTLVEVVPSSSAVADVEHKPSAILSEHITRLVVGNTQTQKTHTLHWLLKHTSIYSYIFNSYILLGICTHTLGSLNEYNFVHTRRAGRCIFWRTQTQ